MADMEMKLGALKEGAIVTKKILFILILSVILSTVQMDNANAAQISGQLIVINKSTNQLAYFNNGQLIRTFAVGTGRSDSFTPEGSFMIVNKIKNRPYYKDNIPGGSPLNPLGDRWLGLNARGTYGTTYGIHGNSNPASIGKYVSSGCVRMYDDEVRWLFDQVALYTPVYIGHFDSFESAAVKSGYQLLPPIEVFVDQQPLELEDPPLLIDNRTLVPLRSLFSALGASVKWDQQTKSVTAIKGNNKTKLTIGSNKALINGTEKDLDVPAIILNGKTYVPVRFVTEAFEIGLSWDQKNRKIHLME